MQMGTNIQSQIEDPNGPPGRTAGGVNAAPALAAAVEATAGNTVAVPPYLVHPSVNVADNLASGLDNVGGTS